jgi:hypothetical protein
VITFAQAGVAPTTSQASVAAQSERFIVWASGAAIFPSMSIGKKVSLKATRHCKRSVVEGQMPWRQARQKGAGRSPALQWTIERRSHSPNGERCDCV